MIPVCCPSPCSSKLGPLDAGARDPAASLSPKMCQVGCAACPQQLLSICSEDADRSSVSCPGSCPRQFPQLVPLPETVLLFSSEAWHFEALGQNASVGWVGSLGEGPEGGESEGEEELGTPGLEEAASLDCPQGTWQPVIKCSLGW